jgi:hypothetical protein
MQAALTSDKALLIPLGAAVLGISAFVAGAAAKQIGYSPGRRALIHWTPIACAVLAARYFGAWDVALAIIFGTSVAVMSGVLGAVALAAPVGPAPANWKRLWPFVLATVLLIYVSGFNGLLTWKHGLALIVEGLALLSLWQDSSATTWHDAPNGQAPTAPPTGSSAGSLEYRPAGSDRAAVPSAAVAAIALAISGTLAICGAFAAIRGTAAVERISPGAIGAALFSFALTVPMVSGDRRLALNGSSWLAATSQIGIVFLNFCVLLPIVALIPYAAAFFRAVHVTARPILDVSTFQPHVTPFPLAHWRIDTVMLILLGVLLLPVSMGKWNLSREEGVILLVAYGVYLAATTLAGMAV